MIGDIVLKALLGTALEYTEQNVIVLYILRYWGGACVPPLSISMKTLIKLLLLPPFVHKICHYSRNLSTWMMENHREEKEMWILSETRATFFIQEVHNDGK